MAEERDDEQTTETEATSGQQPTGQQGQQGQQPPIAGQQGQQSEVGQEQDEQAGDLASEQTMTGGFIGSQAPDSDESSETLDRSDFANQGQGAKEGSNENIETGQRQESESDVEGSSDKT
jgi:hypothetical protein